MHFNTISHSRSYVRIQVDGTTIRQFKMSLMKPYEIAISKCCTAHAANTEHIQEPRILVLGIQQQLIRSLKILSVKTFCVEITRKSKTRGLLVSSLRINLRIKWSWQHRFCKATSLRKCGALSKSSNLVVYHLVVSGGFCNSQRVTTHRKMMRRSTKNSL